MPFRSILLRVLFWSLALAAVFGAIGVLFASYDSIWRVTGTSIVTAGAALLLLGASAKMDKPASRPASLLAVTLIAVEYLLTLGAIWDVVDLTIGNRGSDDSLWMTVLFVALVGVPAIAFMRMMSTALTALAGRVGLALAAVELAMLLVVAWEHGPWYSDWTFGELAAGLPPFALLVVICLIGHGTGPRRPWRWIGVAASAVGYLAIVYGTIKHIHSGGEVVIYLACAGASVAHANIVLLCPLRPAQIWLRWLTIAFGIATALFVGVSTYVEHYSTGMIARFAGACAIFAGCGTLALAVLARLNRRFVAAPGAMTGLSEITLFCPVCRKKQTLPLGSGQCAECHVLIHVRVEEPRCATCGYSLLMLPSGICPECGTPVPISAASSRDLPNGADIAPISAASI